MSLTICVPAFNESHSIEKNLKRLTLFCESNIKNYQIIFIDDGSTDNTFLLGSKLFRKEDLCLKKVKNEGLAAAYKTAINHASKDYFILFPSDNAWNPQDLMKIYDQRNKAEIIIPYLVQMNDKSRFRKILSRVYVIILNALFIESIKYYNGIVLHKTENLKAVKCLSNSFAYQTEYLLKMIKLKQKSYIQIPFNTNQRESGKSKALKVDNILKVLSDIQRLFFEIMFKESLFNKKVIATFFIRSNKPKPQ